ncbi:MAG: HD domain-containing protein [Patescibacteria group bacterium]|nr:MAG: HD domain-containing protein [Patescibacteria group bacterium]
MKEINFLFELGTLRFVDRTWRQFMIPEMANVAEHSFRVAWIALLLSKTVKEEEGLEVNLEKVLKLSLMHDIAETRTGDTHYVSRLYVKRDEEKAFSDMAKDLLLEGELLELFADYEKRESLEAKIVKDADTLDVELELKETAMRANPALVEGMEESRRAVRENHLYTDCAKKFWDKIVESSPADWHIKGVNRFTKGDWKE